jgi:hypothetical protein
MGFDCCRQFTDTGKEGPWINRNSEGRIIQSEWIGVPKCPYFRRISYLFPSERRFGFIFSMDAMEFLVTGSPKPLFMDGH